MINPLGYLRLRALLSRLAGIAVVAVWFMACQELPSEPTPIDLSRDQPVANDDQATTLEETLVKIQVLANDSSLVGDDLEVTEIVTAPSFGEASIVANAIEYVPEVDYNGPDSLRYRVSGEVLSSTARVTISVTPVNDPPVAMDDSFIIDETIAIPKGQLATLDVLANDTDVDGDVLRVIRTTPASSGSLQIAGDGFSVSYEPNADFTGNDQFTYTIADGNGGQDLATVVVSVRPVNDPPVAVDNQYATQEDTPRQVTVADGVLANDTDPEGDQLTAVLMRDVEHGVLSLMSDGSFTYSPDQDFNGGDSFTYVASDGLSDSQPATVSISVLAVNDPPVAQADQYGAEEDVTLEVSAPGVLSNDTDIDGDDLRITLLVGTMHGELDLRGDGSFTYVPNAGFSGDDGFEYQIDDGTLASAATVSINVGSVNDPPVAQADQFDVSANLVLEVPPPGVLENDSDEDGDLLVALLIEQPEGSLQLQSDGSFTYEPPPGFSGTDEFVYRASDGASVSGEANVVILVSALKNPPVSVDDEYEVPANDTLLVEAPGVLENDTDEDGDELTAVLVDDVVEGTLEFGLDGGFKYIPSEDFVGTVSFTYRARDGANVSGIATVTITIGP